MQNQIEECGMAEEIDVESTAVEEATVEEGAVGKEFDGRFQFNGCRYVTVYVKSGNANGNKYTNSGNIAPQVIRMSYLPSPREFSAH